MKKRNLFIVIAAIAAMTCLSGCDDESKPFNPEDYELTDGAMDITNGMNIVIMENEADMAEGIEVPIKGDVTISSTNPAIKYSCVHRDDKTFIVPKVASSNKELMLVDDVTVSVPQNPDIAAKKIKVIIRKGFQMDNASAIGNVSEKVANRIIDLIGMGFDVADEIGTVKSNVIDKEFLLNIHEKAPSGILSFNNASQPNKQVYREGYTYSSMYSAYSNSIGLNFFIPIKTLVLGFGGKGSWSESKRTENSYEYAMASERAIKAEGYIVEDALAGYASENNLDENYWLPVITKYLNNALNNPGSIEYKRYPETEEGTYKLIEKYGGWFYTACQIGGSYEYRFSKKMDVSASSLKWGLSLDLSLKHKLDDCTDLGDYLQQQASRNIVDVNYEHSEDKEEIYKNMECESEVYSNGGTYIVSGSKKVWDIGSDPDNWVPVSYGTQAVLENMESKNSPNPFVHYLYELCADQNSTRAKAIKKALTPDADGYVPYFAYLHGYKDIKEGQMVLADVILIEKTGNITASEDSPITRMTPSDGKIRTYYPLVANVNQGFMTPGRNPNLQMDYFSGETTRFDNSRLYVYYALDWNGPNIGMTNVRLGKTAKQGESIRGVYTDKNLKGDPADGCYYIIAEWAGEKTPISDKITGVGLKYTDWDTDNGKYAGLVFAATGGTEWDKASAFKSGEAAETYFLKYWDKYAGYHKCEKDSETQSSFVNMKDKGRPHTMHLCWTKKPIERDMTGYKSLDNRAYEEIKKNTVICLPDPR